MPFYDLHDVKRSAQGRWAEILCAAGLPSDALDGRNHPCPKCGGRDRFSVFKDFSERGAVHCRKCFTRGSVVPPSDGIATIRWWTGCTFSDAIQFVADHLGLRPSGAAPPPLGLGRHGVAVPSGRSAGRRPAGRIGPALQSTIELDRETIEAHTRFARDAYERIDRETRRWLAQWIYVSESALISLRIGLTSDRRCTTWPMRNASGEIVGVRIATLPWTDGATAKWSRRGSQSGLFVPRENVNGQRIPGEETRLFICEGESDTAAAVSLGLWAIGRASANASTYFVQKYVERLLPKRLTIIADHDSPGQRGARQLAKAMCASLPDSVPNVEVVQPPGSGMDLRDWIADGANQNDIRSSTPLATFSAARQRTFQFSDSSANT